MADLYQRAEAKLKPGMMSFFTGVPYDEAFEQAGNRFKLEKDFERASMCFERCVHCAEKSGAARFQIANYMLEAGHCLKRINIRKAIPTYEKVIRLWGDDGKMSQCGKLLKEIAEKYEDEALSEEDYAKVESYYSRACDMFEMDEYGKSNLSTCRLKLGEFAARAGNYRTGVEIFEAEGNAALQNNLKKYQAKDHFFKAGVLRLVEGDIVSCKIAHENYIRDDPRYERSREGVLYGKMVAAIEAQSLDDFVLV